MSPPLDTSIAVHERLRMLARPGAHDMDSPPTRRVDALFAALKTGEFFVPARIGCDRGQEISAAAKAMAVDTMLAISEQHPHWRAEDVVHCSWIHTVRVFAGLSEPAAEQEILDLQALHGLIAPMLNTGGAVDFLHQQRGHPLAH